ncbi:hypothetical protein [Pediococcus stilesii]|uniref:hypothetical protein n=1 Tax=Pediococcus stilesii TaxID=331679 RepID=UPI001486BF2C|nr:hypothetical protein [Pediococcus stilesii]
MNQEKVAEISKALSGLTYFEFMQIFQNLEQEYHVTKKELTSDEISSIIEKH